MFEFVTMNICNSLKQFCIPFISLTGWKIQSFSIFDDYEDFTYTSIITILYIAIGRIDIQLFLSHSKILSKLLSITFHQFLGTRSNVLFSIS